jgi:hypothetical protein
MLLLRDKFLILHGHSYANIYSTNHLIPPKHSRGWIWMLRAGLKYHLFLANEQINRHLRSKQQYKKANPCPF